ncbi:MAG: hypothetical protein HON55_04325 [Legionellales bacterium]|mgnify:CR=1 FL=1|jgi:hypothetical protein|nr:hypothetical protein [Legionellales bacterium]
MNLKVSYAFLMSTIICSCTNYQAESFSSNSIDVYTAESNIASQIGVASFSANNPEQNSIFCRGVSKSVYLPNKTTFVKYIEEALTETLINAKRYAKDSKNQLRGKIELVDFNTTAGRWHIKGIFNINNSLPVTIDGKYDFPSAWDNDAACQNAASALNQAVSRFIHDVVINPELSKAIQDAA